ncbi:MAG: hypothetical protein GY898_10850 [Proteobacteria bacterium]|nr:hypothetical protein [Pseudomonadota bacterium]
MISKWMLLPLTAVLAGFVLSGCPPENACVSENDCVEKDETGFDLVWTCSEEGLCEATPCEGPGDCQLLQHCQALPQEFEEVRPEHFCAEGCGSDNDCPAGNFCREGECEPKPCRNGHLDCDLAETCQGGVCVDAGFPFCNSCNPNQNVYDPGDDLNACDTVAVGHPFCGDGNFCWNLPNGPSCGVPCSDNSDCPGGFSCGQALISGPACPGDVQVVGKYCVSDFCFDGF